MSQTANKTGKKERACSAIQGVFCPNLFFFRKNLSINAITPANKVISVRKNSKLNIILCSFYRFYFNPSLQSLSEAQALAIHQLFPCPLFRKLYSLIRRFATPSPRGRRKLTSFTPR